jgi:tetratricopeptide (TPR) repeat protein
VLLSNAGDSPLEQIFTGITDILYNRTPVYPKQLVSELIADEYKKHGIDSAMSIVRNMVSINKDTLDTNENDLNRLGYRILSMGLLNESVLVFKLNTELYPDAWNVWDSYGEALAIAGKNEEAITAYKRSVHLNPSSVKGLESIKNLQ